VPGFGAIRARRFEARFGTLGAAWKASPATLRASGLSEKLVAALDDKRRRMDLAAEVERIRSSGTTLYALPNPSYPWRLAEIYSPSMVLYVRGGIIPDDDWVVGMVGTRRCTPYGRQAAESLASDLARNGLTIVSGLAVGIDAFAHQAALDAGGRSIAVLGSGVDQIYPYQNRKLAERMIERGALVSEYPLGVPPDRRNFQQRNRIITGLSRGLIMMEAGIKSGAMISAGFAAEQGRDLMVVPGKITDLRSQGTNHLLKQGATLVTSAEDVLQELNIQMVAQK